MFLLKWSSVNNLVVWFLHSLNFNMSLRVITAMTSSYCLLFKFSEDLGIQYIGLCFSGYSSHTRCCGETARRVLSGCLGNSCGCVRHTHYLSWSPGYFWMAWQENWQKKITLTECQLVIKKGNGKLFSGWDLLFLKLPDVIWPCHFESCHKISLHSCQVTSMSACRCHSAVGDAHSLLQQSLAKTLASLNCLQ